MTISSQNAAEGAEWKAEKGFPFPLLADEDLAVIRAYDVYHENESKGRDIARPSTFVIDPSGMVTWRYVGERSSDRPSIDDILAQVGA